MSIEQENRGDVLVLRLAGRLDSSNAPELERVLLDKLATGTNRLVFDLSALDYVSSAGLRVVLLAGKKLRGSRGQLALAGVRDMVREVLDMSGFLALFVVTATVEEAIAGM